MKKLEEEYLRKNNRYDIERKLISCMWEKDFKEFINDKKLEEKFYKERLIKYMQKLLKNPNYKNFDDLQKIYFEWVIYIKAGWKELEETRDVLKNLQYLYDLKFTSKNNDSNLKILTRENIEKVKNIDIEQVVIKYTNSKINHNKALKCPLHKDNRASFQIYKNTNSFYCYGCSIWWTPIEFVANLFKLNNKEAIEKLKTDFLYFN